MSTNSTPSSVVTPGTPTTPPPPPHPIQQACSRVFDAFKTDNTYAALQAFDELQALDLEQHSEFKADVLRAWGRAVQCAAIVSGNDVEHLEEMIEDYEHRFHVEQVWQLRALLLEAPTASGAFDELLAVLENHYEHDYEVMIEFLVEMNRPNRQAILVEDPKDVAEAERNARPKEGAEAKDRVLRKVYDGLDGLLEKHRTATCADSAYIRGALLRLFGEKPVQVVTAGVTTALQRRDRRARDAGALEDEDPVEDTNEKGSPTQQQDGELDPLGNNPSAPVLDIPAPILEKLQRPYLARMRSKTEDAEDVLEEMVRDGLKPVNTFPYSFIFMKTTFKKPAMMGHYLDMLMFGVKPQESIHRILARNPSLTKDEHYFVKRRLAGKTEMEDFYDRLLRNKQYSNPLEAATKIFQCMALDGVTPDRYAYTFIISCCHGQPAAAEEWYRRMIDDNVQPNAATFSHLLTIWRDAARYADSAEKWIIEIGKRELTIDNHHYASLLDAYVRCGSRQRAQACFKALLVRGECSVPVYNSVMKLGPFDWALGCLACMLSDGMLPTSHTRSTLQNQARDSIAESIVTELANAQWHKDGILTCAAVVSPARGTNPSLSDCMRLMMREMKMTDEEMRRRLEKLSAEIDLAKAR